MSNINVLKDKIVIELGAGTGLLGMVCHNLGANQVILTDNDQKSLTHMKIDCESNNIFASVLHLDWFSPDITQLSSLILNNDGGDKEVVIVAGDVLYKSILINPFFDTVKKLFQNYKVQSMYLCHIPRADVDHSAVLQAIHSIGLQVEVIDVDLWRKGCCLENAPAEDFMRAQLFNLSEL